MKQKLIAGPIEGFKATDENMTCRGFQYELGEIYELPEGAQLELCQNGFHFCKYQSGVFAYYPYADTRVFKVLAWDVLELPKEPGADYKLVARKIQLVEEIKYDATGYRNTGNGNTGDRNTGNGNTGDRNTGDRNIGNGNTGYRNTGNWNTGDRNIGNGNIGNGNTGNWNTGDRNIGNGNTGYRNMGNWNTGSGNACDKCSDSLCTKPSPVRLFDLKVANPDKIKWQLVYQLSEQLMKDKPIDPTPYLSLPNATAARIKKLHEAHIARRKK